MTKLRMKNVEKNRFISSIIILLRCPACQVPRSDLWKDSLEMIFELIRSSVSHTKQERSNLTRLRRRSSNGPIYACNLIQYSKIRRRILFTTGHRIREETHQSQWSWRRFNQKTRKSQKRNFTGKIFQSRGYFFRWDDYMKNKVDLIVIFSIVWVFESVKQK